MFDCSYKLRYVIMIVSSNLYPATGGSVCMELFFTFLVTVAVGVVCHLFPLTFFY